MKFQFSAWKSIWKHSDFNETTQEVTFLFFLAKLNLKSSKCPHEKNVEELCNNTQYTETDSSFFPILAYATCILYFRFQNILIFDIKFESEP